MVAELLAEAELGLVLRLFFRMGRFGDFDIQHDCTLSLYIQAHRRTAVRVMVEPIITPPRCKYNPLFTFCEFCVAKSARMVFDSFAPFSTGRWWKLWKTKPCTACFFAVFPFLTQESSRVFHAFHGVFNISTVDNPYTRWITFPEYTECERYVKLYRQKKLDANNSPII